MTALVVATTTLVVVAAAGYGAWRGGRQIGRRIVLLVAAWLAAIGATALAWQQGWFRPFGLVTPAVFGTCALLLVATVLRRCWRPPPDGPSRGDRLFGTALGVVCGIYVAGIGWVMATAVGNQLDHRTTAGAGATAAKSTARVGDALGQLLRTANDGFVRHLPVLGELSGEFEALVTVLNTPPEIRQRFVDQQRWAELTELESFRALCDDEQFWAEIDCLRGGELLALYRIQNNPRFLAFFASEPVQQLLPTLRPSAIAEALRAAGEGR